jgi:hypothetical protein
MYGIKKINSCNIDTHLKSRIIPILSSRRRPGSSDFGYFWTPAFAGVTGFGTFYGFITLEGLTNGKFRNVGHRHLPRP